MKKEVRHSEALINMTSSSCKAKQPSHFLFCKKMKRRQCRRQSLDLISFSRMIQSCCWSLLLLLSCISTSSEAAVPILNATKSRTSSSNTIYEYEASLQSDSQGNVLVFRWKTPQNGLLNASLEHTTKTASLRPSWLGFGIFDWEKNSLAIVDERLQVITGEAIVGTVVNGIRSVLKYDLGSPHGTNSSQDSNAAGVDLLPDSEQSLVFKEVIQGQVTLEDGSTAQRTTLIFSKKLDEGNSQEPAIKANGDNIFLWASGEPGARHLGMHDHAGAFRLNFQTQESSSPLSSVSQSYSISRNLTSIVNATASFQPVPNDNNPNANYDNQVVLYNNLTLYWQDPTDGVFSAKLEHHAADMASAPSWLALGFYDVLHNPRPITPENFVMNGSTAVIGTSWSKDKPKVYTLGYNHRTPGVIQPIDSKHLQDSYFLQSDILGDSGDVMYTTLTFKMSMKNPSPNEPIVVAVGDNIFMWAMGPPRAQSLGIHSEYGVIRLDLSVNGLGSSPNIPSVNIIDGSTTFIKSTDPQFDFQVQLEEDTFFRWKKPDPVAGIFSGRLEHTTKFVEAAPAWLGFGFPSPTDTSTWMLMKETIAIIGELPTEKVQKYSLGANNNHTSGFVQPLPSKFQTLEASKMIQTHNDDTGIITTTLTFAKKMIETANPSEGPIWTEGENRFLWAVGNALSEGRTTLGMHRNFGGLKIDFAKVEAAAASDSTTDSGSYDQYVSPVIVGQCSSTIFERAGKSIHLSPDLSMHWTLNGVDPQGLVDFGEDPSVTVVLQYSGLAWLGFGFSDSAKAHALGSSSVIGLPQTTGRPQLEYNISAITTSGIVPLDDQTLIESYIKQENGQTMLRFTRALEDGKKEVVIKSKGLNFFSFAVGNGNTLGYHRHRSSFQLDLSDCFDGPSSKQANNAWQEGNGKRALTAHAVLAAIAWGFAMPCAIGVAWFRQLIPTTWIYVHVSFNLLSFVLTLLAVLIGIGAVSSRGTSRHFSEPHHWVGLFLFLFITFQVANGFLRPPVTRREDGAPVERKVFSLQPPQSARELWHMIHRSCGIIMVLVGIFQIASGMKLYDRDFQSGRGSFFWYWTYISLFALVMLFMKIYLLIKDRGGGKDRWFEDRAATSVGIEQSMMASDPDGLDFDGNMVLEIPSRTGEPTVIRGARRVDSSGSPNSSTSDFDEEIDEIHLDDSDRDYDNDHSDGNSDNGESHEENTPPEIL